MYDAFLTTVNDAIEAFVCMKPPKGSYEEFPAYIQVYQEQGAKVAANKGLTRPVQAYCKEKTKSTCITLVADSGEQVRTDVEEAELLAEHFRSVYTPQTQGPNERTELHHCCKAKLAYVYFIEDDVYRAARKCPASYTITPDGIPPILLRGCSKSLSLPLAIIFNSSMTTGALPLQFEQSFITPIPKRPPAFAKIFRPISITSIVARTMERLVRRRLLNFLDEHNVLPESQYGFRPQRSVRDALIGSIESWSKAIDSNVPVDVVYFDMTAAFDKVPHNRLLHKLSSCGIDGYLLEWVRFFLTGRESKTCVDNLVLWANRNELPLSVPKCNVLHLGTNNRKQAYYMDRKQIAEEECVYVRPIVETCSATFVLTTKKEVEHLESVQRRFTKAAFSRAFPCEGMPNYRERCRRLDLETLEERRVRSDLILAKKILLGKCATKNLFRMHQSRTRGGATKFTIPYCRTKMRESTFFVRTAATLSKLNIDFVLSSSLGVFKEFVKDLDLSDAYDQSDRDPNTKVPEKTL
ncbi:RNA-directed DNA polymerase from mobile element jockey-like protein [Aphelenchoides avenae]|nr:RNA-directed DNA polymerase from mobile element jockey-like protein [Aphelenchus avenae]